MFSLSISSEKAFRHLKMLAVSNPWLFCANGQIIDIEKPIQTLQSLLQGYARDTDREEISISRYQSGNSLTKPH